jgi:hypothetical protein
MILHVGQASKKRRRRRRDDTMNDMRIEINSYIVMNQSGYMVEIISY